MHDISFLLRYIDKADLFPRILQQRDEARGINTTKDCLSVRMQQSLQDKSMFVPVSGIANVVKLHCFES